MTDQFLPQQDELAGVINRQALILYEQLKSLPVDELGLPQYCLNYFKSSHYSRLFFSLETSASLLYHSITLKNKSVRDVTIMDYGAGVGTLYMLAKMIGCKKVIYNDFLQDWQTSAQKLAGASHIQIDEYILGDIDDTVNALRKKNISCDIIVSRNVIEHIYRLDEFYETLYTAQPNALVYSSTTANYYNPGTHIQHVRWHRKWEKVYRRQRMELIRKQITGIDTSDLMLLAAATRGLAGNDLLEAIDTFKETKLLPDPNEHYTNTCTPDNGIWVEHLLTFQQYRKLIDDQKYSITFLPGFWDTHYQKSWMNNFSKLMNSSIHKLSGKARFIIAPFIYVVAEPKKQKQ